MEMNSVVDVHIYTFPSSHSHFSTFCLQAAHGPHIIRHSTHHPLLIIFKMILAIQIMRIHRPQKPHQILQLVRLRNAFDQLFTDAFPPAAFIYENVAKPVHRRMIRYNARKSYLSGPFIYTKT